MKIANVMFGRGLGGIEQAFLDYNEALLLAGHEVLAITHPLAAINPDITGNVTHETLGNHGSWDLITARRLRKLYRNWEPDFIISHGNRAISLNLQANHTAIHLGITHNYNLRRFSHLDAVIATTHQLRDAAIAAGVTPQCIYHLPNMVRLPERAALINHPPHIIGAMGRMVEKKGFHLLLQAASLLKEQNVSFHLMIGGTGRLENRLQQQCQQLGLQNHVTFLGWVEDKATFFDRIDIFCLPSLHEPFGIVLLEAMAFGCPVIGFRSEGPSEIIANNEAVLVETGNIHALADALKAALQNNALAEYGQAGRAFVGEYYALSVISQQLDNILRLLKEDNTLSISAL